MYHRPCLLRSAAFSSPDPQKAADLLKSRRSALQGLSRAYQGLGQAANAAEALRRFQQLSPKSKTKE